MAKKCFHCNAQILSKRGFHKGHQRYKSASCGKVFIDRIKLNFNEIWEEYTKGKQTYFQLATKYKCSIKTIQRKIDNVEIESHLTPILTGIPNKKWTKKISHLSYFF